MCTESLDNTKLLNRNILDIKIGNYIRVYNFNTEKI